jgi:hypothetical protein
MRRIFSTIVAIVLCVPALPAHAAGVFNGSTSDLSATVSSTAPDYPILMACWFKPANVTSNGTLIALSDDGAGGSLDALTLAARGDVASDPVRAEATAGGSASQSSTSNGFTANNWYLAIGYFESNASRKAVLSTTALTDSPTWSTEETTTRAVGNYTKVSIGSLHNGGAGTRFNGWICHAAIWSGVDPDLVDVGVKQLTSGVVPWSERHILHDNLLVYQPLLAGINDSDSVGPTMTETAVTFHTGNVQPLTGYTFGYRTFPASTGDIKFRWPFAAPAGPLPGNRVVKLVDGFLQLADAADDAAIGAASTPTYVTYLTGFQSVTQHSSQFVRVEIAAGDALSAGDVAYQADDGYAASTGTVRIGVAYEGGTAGDAIRVLPSWGQ